MQIKRTKHVVQIEDGTQKTAQPHTRTHAHTHNTHAVSNTHGLTHTHTHTH